MLVVTHKYETIMIIDVRKTEEETNAIIEKFKSLISSAATLENIDVWGKRKLAYPINYQNEGFYVLVNFESAPEFPKELERVYNITEGLLRTIVVRRADGALTVKPEQKVEIEAKSDAKAEQETKAEVTQVAKAKKEGEAEHDVEVGNETEVETKSVAKAEQETDAEAKPAVKAKKETETEAKPAAKAKKETDTEAKPAAKAKKKAEAASEVAVQADAAENLETAEEE